MEFAAAAAAGAALLFFFTIASFNTFLAASLFNTSGSCSMLAQVDDGPKRSLRSLNGSDIVY